MQQHSMFESLTEIVSLNGNKIVQAGFLCVFKLIGRQRNIRDNVRLQGTMLGLLYHSNVKWLRNYISISVQCSGKNISVHYVYKKLSSTELKRNFYGS